MMEVMPPMPPSHVRRVRARDLAFRDPGYLVREYGEPDDAWKQVKSPVICELRPDEGSLLPEVCTVEFTDDTERYFNPDDWVEMGFA